MVLGLESSTLKMQKKILYRLPYTPRPLGVDVWWWSRFEGITHSGMQSVHTCWVIESTQLSDTLKPAGLRYGDRAVNAAPASQRVRMPVIGNAKWAQQDERSVFSKQKLQCSAENPEWCCCCFPWLLTNLVCDLGSTVLWLNSHYCQTTDFASKLVFTGIYTQ